jgi:hypothetical protein
MGRMKDFVMEHPDDSNMDAHDAYHSDKRLDPLQQMEWDLWQIEVALKNARDKVSRIQKLSVLARVNLELAKDHTNG